MLIITIFKEVKTKVNNSPRSSTRQTSNNTALERKRWKTVKLENNQITSYWVAVRMKKDTVGWAIYQKNETKEWNGAVEKEYINLPRTQWKHQTYLAGHPENRKRGTQTQAHPRVTSLPSQAMGSVPWRSSSDPPQHIRPCDTQHAWRTLKRNIDPLQIRTFQPVQLKGSNI